MIPLREQELLREQFKSTLTGTVKLDFFTQRPTPVFVPGREACLLCDDTEQLLSELAHLSDKIDLRVHEFGTDRALEERYEISRVPATVVRGVINRPVVFYGMPAPMLFSVLLAAIMDASGPGPDLLPALRRKLKRLKKLMRVQVFVLPADEASVQQALNVQALSMGSQHLRAEIIEIAEFPKLAEQLEVRSVPTTIIDGRIRLTGHTPPEELVESIVQAAEHEIVASRPRLITDLTGAAGAPLPRPPAADQGGTVRPSGLFIPRR